MRSVGQSFCRETFSQRLYDGDFLTISSKTSSENNEEDNNESPKESILFLLKENDRRISCYFFLKGYHLSQKQQAYAPFKTRSKGCFSPLVMESKESSLRHSSSVERR